MTVTDVADGTPPPTPVSGALPRFPAGAVWHQNISTAPLHPQSCLLYTSQGLETAAQDAERVRKVYAGALQAAATAARNLKQRNE